MSIKKLSGSIFKLNFIKTIEFFPSGETLYEFEQQLWIFGKIVGELS